MKNHIANFVCILFLLFSASSHALVVVEDNWLEITSDVYAFNEDHTEITAHGTYAHTGGASTLSNSTVMLDPLPHSLGSSNTDVIFKALSLMPSLPLQPSLPVTVFSGLINTNDDYGNRASSFLITNWRFRTNLIKTRFEIGMLAEEVPDSRRISFAIINNADNTIAYRGSGAASFPPALYANGILPQGDYTLIMKVDRSDQPLGENSVGDGFSHFFFAVDDQVELSNNLTHTPVPMPRWIRPINQPTRIKY